jgi:hypothetical protein
MVKIKAGLMGRIKRDESLRFLGAKINWGDSVLNLTPEV